MIVETYLEGRTVKEVFIDLNTFRGRLEEFIKNNDIKSAKILTSSFVRNGVSMLLNSSFDMDEFKISEFNDCLLLTFKEGSGVITISEEANVCLDLLNKRIILRDFGMSVSFSK